VGAVSAQTWSIQHHTIEASLDPAQAQLRVTDRVDFGAPPAPDAPLRLLLHRDLGVEALSLGEIGLRFESMDGFQPRHFWRRPPYDRLEDYAVAREIEIAPPAEGWPEQVVLDIAYAGAVYDSLHAPEVAYQRSFEKTSGLIDERGAFLFGGSFWIPWVGEGTFRYQLTTLTPAGWESVSQGRRLLREPTEEGEVRTVWEVRYPMTEAYLIAGPYTVRESAHGPVALYTFTYADTDDELCQTYLDATGRYLDLYGAMIGPYPFTKFAMVENWWQTGYGMPSFTFLGDKVIRLPFIVHTSYGHEILHNWWGNGVFVDYDGGNWCEGLTTYLADHLYKEEESPQAAADYRRAALQGYLDYAVSGGRDFPLREFTERESASTQAVGYGKTMMVFHMAHRRAGDELFEASLRDFYRENLFEEASWDDIVMSFDKITRESWADWFEQWIGEPGAMDLRATLEEDDSGLWLVLEQGEPVYQQKVPVRLHLGETVRDWEIPMLGSSERVELPAGTTLVEVDPEYDLFRRLHRGEIPPALSQTLGAEKSVVVVGADTDPATASALRALGEEWARHQDMLVVDESDYVDDPQRSVWLLGEGPLLRALLEKQTAYGAQPAELLQAGRDAGNSVVLTLRDPQDEERSWSIFQPAGTEWIESVGGKLTHYGRYGYLVFEGDKNVDKGSFTVENSPMRFVVEVEG
jgi:hypothetical protein